MNVILKNFVAKGLDATQKLSLVYFYSIGE
jgi:hypothetical protein